ncbi:MAG: PASTA domain-containing protein [Alistipes sp.]|nr:PASTA domain-containing protein [Alistipes sp.]
MEENKRQMQREIMSRLKWIYILFICIILFIVGKLVIIQFADREISRASKRIHRNIIRRDTLYAHRGSILSRDGKPLATSIFRRSIVFDFGSEGFDNRERFLEGADTLSKLLAAYFKDKSAKEYFSKMVSTHDRCLRYELERYDTVRYSEGFFAELFGIKNRDSLKAVYRTVRTHSYTKLFRDVDANEWQTLKTYPVLNESLGRVYTIEKHDARVYPHNDLALRTIGRSDEHRHYGIEHAYREQLAGTGGYRWRQRIAPGFYTTVEDEEHRPQKPVDGADIHTTLDVDVQDVADKALRHTLEEEGAIWGTTIVMECSTGDILAMVNLGRAKDGSFVENRNYALGSRTEPGSTFKLASSLALIDDAGVSPSKRYHSGLGKRVQVGKYNTIQDSHAIGRETGGVIDMRTAFAESANVYFTKAIYDAYHETPQRYVNVLRRLHLDQPMGLTLLGEVTPILPSPENRKTWYGSTLANLGYGYAIELAPIQTLTLYNAVANGGRMVAPRLVTHITHESKTIEEFPTQTLVDSICSQRTLATLRSMLEEVALSGTAKEFFGEEKCTFRVGAKTGTAKIAQGNIKYSDGYYLGSMVTYLPAEAPRYTLMTAIFKRKGTGKTVYGAGLAGPVQKQVATFLHNRETNTFESDEEQREHRPTEFKGGNIVHIREVAEEFDIHTSCDSRKGWGATESVGSDGRMRVSTLPDNKHLMPNVLGMGLADALFILESQGAKVAFTGSGKVVVQSKPEGVEIMNGETVTLKLE